MCPSVGSRDAPQRFDATNRPDAGAPSAACPSLLAATASGIVFSTEPPECWFDLHLEDVVASMALGSFQRAVWHTPLTDLGEVAYRQEVVAELMEPDCRQAALEFTGSMAASREWLAAADACPFPVPADLYRQEAMGLFTSAVLALERRLAELSPRSAGLRRVATHLAGYVGDESFAALVEARASLLKQLRDAPFVLGLRGGTVWVDADTGEVPWADAIEYTFARFSEHSQAAPVVLPARPVRAMNHVEARMVELVAELRPEAFARLHGFVEANAGAVAGDLVRLSDELAFYLRFVQLADSLAGEGVRWCLPHLLSRAEGTVQVAGMVDLALALKAGPSDTPLVPNDLALGPKERVVFISGPNQGGKTTFARAFGLLAYLTSLGLPVPAAAASLPVLCPVLTHFPRPEDPVNGRGALADEMVRLHRLLERADARSLVLVNELFSSTSIQDASELATLVQGRFARVGCLVLWVTLQDELVAEQAVSLVGQVAEDDPTRPTFQFRRQPPAGRSRAAALAAGHGLRAADVARRLL